MHRGITAIKVYFGKLGERFFRSGYGSGLVGRVKVHDVELFAVALPDDFIHLHAGLEFENHKRPLTRQAISPPTVYHTNVARSALGQKRRFDAPPTTSGQPQSTDIITPAQLVRLVPIASLS